MQIVHAHLPSSRPFPRPAVKLPKPLLYFIKHCGIICRGVAMGDELLNAIIQLENRIQQQLQDEQARADRWLAVVVDEQQLRISQTRKKLQAAEQRAVEQARSRAEKQAATMLQNEMEYCSRLEEINRDVLVEVLGRRLADILPGQSDDHQNGQS